MNVKILGHYSYTRIWVDVTGLSMVQRHTDTIFAIPLAKTQVCATVPRDQQISRFIYSFIISLTAPIQ